METIKDKELISDYEVEADKIIPTSEFKIVGDYLFGENSSFIRIYFKREEIETLMKHSASLETINGI